MRGARRRQLEQTVAALRTRYGDGVLRRASELSSVRSVPHIPTGFGELDALTGCGGVPQGALTLLRGRTTSGKLTLAYKTLASLHRAMPTSASCSPPPTWGEVATRRNPGRARPTPFSIGRRWPLTTGDCLR